MRRIGLSYKQRSVGDNYDAIVIGSGIGGLTAAALLAKHGGQKVLVLERHYVAGGFTQVFRRPGYEWDVGVHYIGVNDPNLPVRAAFNHLTEGRLRWNPMPDVYERVQIEGRSYEFPAGRERFRARMKEYFPAESQAIDGYLAAVRAAARATNLYFMEKAIPAPAARLVGGLLRWRFLRYARQTTAEVLRQFTNNQELAAVLTAQWGCYGLPPSQSSFGMHAMVAAHFMEGAAYPVGGASEIAAGIAPVIERAGGQIMVCAAVSEILLDGRGHAMGVRLADGRELKARNVISDAGAHNTFERLLPPGLTSGLRVKEDIKRIPPSVGHACLYVGLKRDAGEAEFDGSNLWIYKNPDHDANMSRFMADPSAPFPFLFISFPSAKDPAFARRCPGRSTIQVLTPMPYGAFGRWAGTRWRHRGQEYEEFKQNLAGRLLRELEQHVPAVRGRIAYSELSTPLSTRDCVNYEHGEMFGLDAPPERFLIRSLGARTGIRGLYLTGADACTSGVIAALCGGVIAASLIVGRNLMAVVSRPERVLVLPVQNAAPRDTDSWSATG